MSVESPCTRICVLDGASGLCLGCGRSGAEIAGWLGFTAAHRREIMDALPARFAVLPSREDA